MKKGKLLVTAIKLFLACALLLALPSCKGSESSVKIQDMPKRLVYYIGEQPDINGASLCVTENGETKTVTVTEEMLGAERDTVFTRGGKASITVTYNGTPIKIDIFVDESFENHKTYALASLSSWGEENTVSDSVSDAIIESAKENILSAQNHTDIVSALENAKKLAFDYTSAVKAAKALLYAKNEALEKLAAFDSSSYAKDHSEDIAVNISECIALIENADSTERVEKYYNDFISKTDKLKNNKYNSIILELEESFKEKYESNRVYYEESEYELLLDSLIKAERNVRECNSDEEASALIKEFLEITATKFNTIPDIVYKKLSLLSEDSLEYGKEFFLLDEIADKILSLLLKSESESTLKLRNKTGKAAIYELVSMENKEKLDYYSALASYETDIETVNLISETESLYRAYDNLEEANKAAKSVIAAIDAIGPVRLDSQSKVTAARKAYSDWSKKYSIEHDGINGSMISNYETLEAAEKTMKELPEKAAKAAEKVRNEIKELLTKSIIYSDTDAGVGDSIRSAYDSYNSWIEKYGSFADTYINDGTNYKLKLDSYNNEYQQIEKMAKNILSKIDELRSLFTKMNYDNYSSLSSQIDTAYKELTELYTSFKNTNGHVTDKISDYDLLEDEILFAKFKVHSDRYCAVIESEFKGYFEKISTDLSFRTQRNELEAAYDKARESLGAVFSYDRSLDLNISALEDEYEEQSGTLKSVFDSYCFDYETFLANEKLIELSKSYSDISFIQKRDAIIAEAQTEISELSRSTTLERYKSALSEIVENARTALKTAFGS